MRKRSKNRSNKKVKENNIKENRKKNKGIRTRESEKGEIKLEKRSK